MKAPTNSAEIAHLYKEFSESFIANDDNAVSAFIAIYFAQDAHGLKLSTNSTARR